MIKYQLLETYHQLPHIPHTLIDQIRDHKHDIYLYGNLSTKQLAQAADKNAKFMLTKNGRLLFFLSLVSEVAVRKNFKQTLL